MNKSIIQPSQFQEIFTNNIPLLDVRAPVEYKKGAFPTSTNIPLLDDEQRQLVGLSYKKNGQKAAVILGHQLISGEIKQRRLKQWQKYFQQHDNALLYCFRGGMRSRLVQQWLHEIGIEVPIIEGGYKALRNYLLSINQQPLNLLRISGKTGVGKTELLQKFSTKIDLEGLAHHRGSAFGQTLQQQPTQIDFENNLAIHILRFNLSKQICIVEDESHYIGSVNIPHEFYQIMQNSAVIILIDSLEERVERIYRDYVKNLRHKYIQRFHRKGERHFNQFLSSSLEKLNKRLGGKYYSQLNNIMQKALQENSELLHKQWIKSLLQDYYDPMFDYQIKSKKDKIIFSGTKKEVHEFITSTSLS